MTVKNERRMQCMGFLQSRTASIGIRAAVGNGGEPPYCRIIWSRERDRPVVGGRHRQHRAQQQPEGALIQHFMRRRHDRQRAKDQDQEHRRRVTAPPDRVGEQTPGRGDEDSEPDRSGFSQQPHGRRINHQRHAGGRGAVRRHRRRGRRRGSDAPGRWRGRPGTVCRCCMVDDVGPPGAPPRCSRVQMPPACSGSRLTTPAANSATSCNIAAPAINAAAADVAASIGRQRHAQNQCGGENDGHRTKPGAGAREPDADQGHRHQSRARPRNACAAASTPASTRTSMKAKAFAFCDNPDSRGSAKPWTTTDPHPRRHGACEVDQGNRRAARGKCSSSRSSRPRCWARRMISAPVAP